jgi:phage terminase large subunit
MLKKIEFELIGHQADFVNSAKRYLLNSGGVGSGKTYSICLKAMGLCQLYPGIFGLLGAQTYPLLRDTTLREFINIVPPEIIKSYNKTEQHFRFMNGSEVIFRSFDDPNKLKSLNLGFAGIEEMTDTTEEIFKMLRTRMRQKGMPGYIFGATNPGTFGNWVYKYFIENPIANSDVIYSISADNDYLPEEYLEDLRELKKSNPEYYERMVMGKWGSLEGIIYMLTMDQRVNELPDKKKIHRWIAGLDFGFEHPTALVIYGIREDTYYQYEEVYQRKLTSSDIIDIIKRKMQDYDIDIIYCDSARPEIIEDLQRAQIPAEAAIKDVFDGIMHVKSMIGDKRLFVNKECTYTLREYDSYIWDAKNTVKEVPIKANDDCFTGNTKIKTARGGVKLKNIKETDLVLTRNGYRGILKLHKKEKDVRTYKIGNKKIICTEDHPFYCLNKKDFINVSDLTDKDMLFMIDKKEALKWQYQKLLYLKELNLDDGRNLNMLIIESISPVIATILNKALGLYIGKFGKTNTGIYRKAFKYIIKMVIRLIIQLKIWNVSSRINIYQVMQNNGIKNIVQRVKFILIQFVLKQLSGIGRKKAENGILNTQEKFLIKVLTLMLNASFVDWYLKRNNLKPTILNSALIIVNQNIGDNLEKIILLSDALNVEKNFILINTEKGFIVQSPVVIKHIGKTKKTMTYNLTVIGTPEYYANDILVHNCMDASRYALYSDSRNLGVSNIELTGTRETAEQW